MARSKLDMQHIMQTVFDSATESLKTTPFSGEMAIELNAADGDSVAVRPMAVDTVILLNNIVASADNTSSAVNIIDYKGYALQIKASSLTGILDGTIQIQASLDNTDYANISTPVTLSTANSVNIVNLDKEFYKYFKIVYTKNGITGGNLTVKYVLKG